MESQGFGCCMPGTGRRLKKGRDLVLWIVVSISDGVLVLVWWGAFSGSVIVAGIAVISGTAEDMDWSIRVRGYSVSGMKVSSRSKRTAKRRALNQLIQAALRRLKKPPTASVSLLYSRHTIWHLRTYMLDLTATPNQAPKSTALISVHVHNRRTNHWLILSPRIKWIKWRKRRQKQCWTYPPPSQQSKPD